MIKKLSKIGFIVFCSVTLAVGLLSCKKIDDMFAGKKKSNQEKQLPIKQAQPIVSVQKPVSSVKAEAKITGSVAEFASVKDPFKPFIIIDKDKKRGPIKRNKQGQALPILNFEVSQFKVTGIIVGLKENTAQIVDPEGRPYVVKTGMEIGRNEGKIKKIASNYIEVYENYIDDSGKRIQNTVRMILPRKE